MTDPIKEKFIIWPTFNLSSANAFNLNQSKILSFGNELTATTPTIAITTILTTQFDVNRLVEFCHLKVIKKNDFIFMHCLKNRLKYGWMCRGENYRSIYRSTRFQKKVCTLFSAIFHCQLCLMSTYLVPKSRSEHVHYDRDFKL